MASRAEVAAATAELCSPNGSLEATFVPRVSMLGWSLRQGGEELLGHPVTFEHYAETGEPTGIPLLHPWANRLACPEYEIAGRRVTLDMGARNVLKDPNGLPIHGLAGASPHWDVVQEEPTRIEALLDYTAWPELERGFPFPHLIELTAVLSDDRLEITSDLIPTGDLPVPVAFGFDPYLCVPGLACQEWWLSDPPSPRRSVPRRRRRTSARPSDDPRWVRALPPRRP